MLQAYLFGGFNLESDGHPLPTIPSLAARSLLAYLLTYRQRSHTRTLLVGLFWPDLPEATARRRLSHALWEIRRTLGSLSADQPCLLTGHESVRFNLALPHWIDVAEFEQALAVPAESLRPDAGQSAVTLYRGDFLAGFYEDWVLLERERLRDQYLAALSQLVERSKGQGRYETALGYAAQLARYDPLREEAHREVMRLYFLLNRPREALQQYLLCRDLLLEELGSEPGAATTRLFQEIQQRLALEPAGIAEPTSRLQGRPLFKAAAPPWSGGSANRPRSSRPWSRPSPAGAASISSTANRVWAKHACCRWPAKTRPGAGCGCCGPRPGAGPKPALCPPA